MRMPRQARAEEPDDPARRARAGSCSAWASSARRSSISRPTSTCRVLRCRGAGDRRSARSDRAILAAGAAAGAHPPGPHRRRLCLPHRSAAAARPGLDAARHPGRRGAALLRGQGAELGARRHDQGAARRRRHRRQAKRSSTSCSPMSGANTWTMRRSPTSIRSSARSTRTRAMARSRSRATTSSSAVAASARSSSSSRPSS